MPVTALDWMHECMQRMQCLADTNPGQRSRNGLQLHKLSRATCVRRADAVASERFEISSTVSSNRETKKARREKRKERNGRKRS